MQEKNEDSIVLPKNYKEEDADIFFIENKTDEITAALQLTVEHNVVVDGYGRAFCNEVKERRLLNPAQYSDNTHSSLGEKIHKIIGGLFSMHSKKLNEAILITDLDSHTYFSWIADVLPRLKLLTNEPQDWGAMISSSEQSKFTSSTASPVKDITTIPVLMPERVLKTYAYHTISVFFDEARIVFIPQHSKVKVANLYLLLSPKGSESSRKFFPAQIMGLRKDVLTELVQKKETRRLQKKLDTLSTLRRGKAQRIYFSRSDAKYRYVKNEAQLLPVLKKYGFNVFEAGRLSFWEQVLLCNRAEIIMGMQGAALTNMIWMPSESSVIEIRRTHEPINNSFFSLAKVLNLDYYYLFAQKSSPLSQLSSFIVNVDQVDELLRDITHTMLE